MSATSSPTLQGSSPASVLRPKDEEAGLPPIETFELLDGRGEPQEKPAWLEKSDEELETRRSLKQTLVDYSCILLNVSSTIAIVFINKM